VPEACPTLNQAMDLAVIFSERNNCTRANPVKVEVGAGEHVMVGVDVGNMGHHMHVSCSNITIVGKGKAKTTILGGFYVNSKQNVKIEQLAVTNDAGRGLYCEGGGTNVDVSKCAVKECRITGMIARDGATVTATQCEFVENGSYGVSCYDRHTKARLTDCKVHHNGLDGLYAFNRAVVGLHGTTTDIHSNKRDGIRASSRAKVNIHLPSQHNTSHGNVGEDQRQWGGGSIVNIDVDSTSTHAIVEEDNSDD